MRLLDSTLKTFFLTQLLGLLAITFMTIGITGAMAAPQVVSDGYVTTGQTGAQTQIDMFHSSKFTITPTATTQILGGNFTMKNGSATVTAGHQIAFILWNSARTVKLAEKLYTATGFCTAHGGTCGNFAPTLFPFDSPVTLNAGTTYYAEVISPDAEDKQSEAYFIKGGKSCSISTATGKPVATATCAGGFVPPGGLPSLSVGKTIKSAQAVPGGKIEYTISVSNRGPGAATSATINDLIPAGVSLVGAVGTNWTCEPVTNDNPLLTCTYNATLAASASTTPNDLVVTVTVGDATSVENWASVDPTGDNSPITPGPDSCTAEDLASGVCAKSGATEIVISGKPSLDILLSDPSPALSPGDDSTYTVTVENHGDQATPGPAHAYIELPAGATFVPDGSGNADWSCSAVPSTDPVVVDCLYKSGAVFPAGPDNTASNIPIVVNIPTSILGGTDMTATAYVARDGSTDPTPPGPVCTPSATVGCDQNSVILASTYGIEKSAPQPPLQAGEQSVYTLTVTTNADGQPAAVRDMVPAGMTLVSGTSSDGWTCEIVGDELLCDNDSLSSGTSTVEITVEMAAGTEGQTMINYASTGPRGNAPEPGISCSTDNCDSNEAKVLPETGFSVLKSAPVPPLQVGEQSTYTLTVTGTGDNVVADVKDQLPQGMTLVSAGGNGWECEVDNSNLVLCQKTISSGTTEEIPVTVSVDPSLEGETVTNYASAGSEGRAPEPGQQCTDPSACAENTSDVLPGGNFTLNKSQPVPPLQVNRQSTYTLSVTTDGENVPVDVKDQLPQGMTLVSAEGDGWTCQPSDQNLVLCQKTMSKGTTEKIRVTVNVEPQINNQDVTNYASAAAEGRAPQPGPACSTDTGGVCASSASKVADIREKIEDAVEDDVQAYLAQRLDQIIGSFDPQSRLQRFRDTACGVSHDLSMNGEATSHEQNLAANGSFSMKGGVVPTADVPQAQCGSYNIWTQLDIGYIDGTGSSSATGGMLTAGAEYLLTDYLLAGVRLSLDYSDASFDSDANSDISGYGWLAGPYISAEIFNNMFLDGFLGYGTSWNDYDGTYENLDLSGDFATQRIAAYLNLSGTYQSGAVLLTPLVGVSYGKEWSDDFKIHNRIVGNTKIDSQDAELGRLKGRVEAGYLITDELNEKFEVFVAPQVTYDMVRNVGDEGDLLLGDGLWRGGVEGGFRFARDRFGANLLVGYDGIGVSDWDAYRGQLQLNYAW